MIEFRPIDAEPALRWSVLWQRSDGTPWVEVTRSRDAYHVRVIGFAEFRVTRSMVEVASEPGARPSTIRHLLLDQVLPLSLAAEGHLVLHASAAFDPRSGVIAMVGAAGAGKSTLAAALRGEGWNVASDDGLLLRTQDHGVVAVPAYPGLRLWPDAAEATGVTSEAVSEVAEYSAKLRVSFPASLVIEPMPLRRVYFVQSGAAAVIEPLSARDAAMALVEHAYRADLTDRAALAAQLDACVRLVDRVSGWRLAVPRDLAQLRDTARMLDAHARVEAG